MASMTTNFVVVVVTMFVAAVAIAECEMLQDVCVADLSNAVKVNGYTCKDSTQMTPEDFYFQGLASAAATNTSTGSVVTGANVEKLPGLNTLGLSMSRIDYAPNGLNPPHVHPRASEIIFVLEGQLYVGFVTTAGKLMAKHINKGDIFVFPKGLLHFQKNVANTPASVIAAFDSQLPGTQSIVASLFGALPDDILVKSFQLKTKQVQRIKSRYPAKK
ncbi:PREDICTED: probable germin-like protein subfamily 2 member 5 [Camelina sativa]|uniref:Germin-like protein n=1 Tax=Camelina sativa TaxID=90675 RepID=A0ABM0VEL5_CAMSA|nr:PREDICTED: probable germin-like protein subfamily 2 member 5 [Camelina sativa]XP_010455009.1 PREDICTED: probable germin-like protein subfamily 2 member 5 [Camelina sativa]